LAQRPPDAATATALARHLHTPDRLPYNQSQLPTVSSFVPSIIVSSFSCLAISDTLVPALSYRDLATLLPPPHYLSLYLPPFFHHAWRLVTRWSSLRSRRPVSSTSTRSFSHYHRFIIRSEPEPLHQLHIRSSTRGSHKSVSRWLARSVLPLPPQLSSTFLTWLVSTRR